MNNMLNKNFLEYKALNKESIKYRLRYDMINDLIFKEYISIYKDDIEYTIHQQNFEFYNGCELPYFNLTEDKCTQILKPYDKYEDVYVIEGTLLDKDENRINKPLNSVLDELIELILEKEYTMPTYNSVCRIYDYYLEDFFVKG